MNTRQARKYLRIATSQQSDYTDINFPDNFTETPTARLIDTANKSSSFPGAGGTDSLRRVHFDNEQGGDNNEDEDDDNYDSNGSIPQEQLKIHSLNSHARPILTQTTQKRLDRLVSYVPGTGTVLQNITRTSKSLITSRQYSQLSQEIGIWRKPSTWCHLHVDFLTIKELLLSSYFNILLICIPIAFVGKFLNWAAWLQFSLNFCAIIPLALLLGDVTEDLALRFGEVIGGLINATFGNVVELTISLVSLSKGLFQVIQLSLLGSILSNMLLVLGMCFFMGGLQFSQQKYSQTVNKVQVSLLFLSCIALIIPDTLKALKGTETQGNYSPEDLQNMSHIIAVILMIMYICFLLFQLHTHNYLFSEVARKEEEQEDENEEEEEEPALSMGAALSLLTIISTLVAFQSEYLISALDQMANSKSVSQTFLSIIILPIAGNACEHLTAVIVAMKDKMDLSVGIAIGSSIQIAMFVLPVTVIIGWIIGENLTLEFDAFGVLALTFSVIHTSFVAGDGASNWLMGLELIATFLIVSVAFWFR
eukprot:TRINITY_DN8890_c0_g1_i4.p1 TRINITY_DN8890_c0_g1~~TRINITY_DN8890_c0_g1_i4.p1  ORF type:complete len:546 (-),score=49.39 TRINITY_DN8890_c0_g1_i4:477-2081(-)